MAQLYQYKARGQSGQILNGSLEADSRKEVAKELREKNLHAVSIKALKAETPTKKDKFSLSMDLADIDLFGGGYKISELSNFAQRLSVLIGAGIPLVRSLTIIKNQSNIKHEKEMLTQLLAKVEAGETLSSALAEQPKYNIFLNFLCI